jgi:hypothetical protein
MNAAQNRVTGGRKSLGGRIKAWLFGSGRRGESKPTVKPQLECLEQRDVPSTLPSTLGADVARFQADFNTLTQVRHQQTVYTPTIQSDVNALVRAVQLSQSSQIVPDINKLQSDMSAEANWYGPYYSSPALNNLALSNDLRALLNDANAITSSQLLATASQIHSLPSFPALSPIPQSSAPSPLGPTLNLSSGFASNANFPYDSLESWVLNGGGNSWEQSIFQRGVAAQQQYGTKLPTTSSIGLGNLPPLSGTAAQLLNIYTNVPAAVANFSNQYPFWPV